jgi:hypothetical protein
MDTYYGHQTVHGFEFTNEYSVSTPATSPHITLSITLESKIILEYLYYLLDSF